jgi:RNA polymerase sigma-70 factor, ECF subfamily
MTWSQTTSRATELAGRYRRAPVIPHRRSDGDSPRLEGAPRRPDERVPEESAAVTTIGKMPAQPPAAGNVSGRQPRPRTRGRLARWYLAAKTAGGDREREHGEGHAPGALLGHEGLAYASALYNVAYYLTRNAPDAEDLVQDTYVRAMRAATQFSRGTNLKAWLFCILRNTFLSLHRRRRFPLPIGELAALAGLTGRGHHEWIRDDLELDRLRNVVREDIERALMTLSEPARTVVLLDFEGLTEAEVAQVVGCAVGTVKSRLARARAALRQQLRDYAK